MGHRDPNPAISTGAAPLLVGIAVVILTGCADGRAASIGTVHHVDDVVEWNGVVELEETRAAISVIPRVRVDPWGGFLVADEREAQIRRYGTDGSLDWHTGGKGSGPGEFQAPAVATRLSSGEVLAADRGGRLTIFDPSGTEVRKTVETDIHRLEDLLVLDDTTLVLSGVLGGNPDLPRLHLWSLVHDSVLVSFFAPLRNAANQEVALTAGWSRVARRGDTLVATFAPSDTLYFFTREGREAGQIPLPSRHFQQGPTDVPRRPLTRPIQQAQFLSRFDFVEGVHWLSDGTLLVPYQTPSAEQALQRRRHLLHVGRSGEPLFETRDGPRLLTVDAGAGKLYFVHPEAEAQNRWIEARLP